MINDQESQMNVQRIIKGSFECSLKSCTGIGDVGMNVKGHHSLVFFGLYRNVTK